LAAVLLAQGCGLFFGDRGAEGSGGAASATTAASAAETTGRGGAGGDGGAGQGFNCEQAIVRDGETWMHSFARATLLDLRIDGSTITFAGRGYGEVKGGVPGLYGPGEHLFVGQVERDGCDIAIKDLGTDYDSVDEARLSQGSDAVHVVWTRGTDLCAADYDALDAPAEVGCPAGASIACSTNEGRFRTPAIALATDGLVISFDRSLYLGAVTCNGTIDSGREQGSRLYLHDQAAFKQFGEKVDRVRMARIGSGEVLMTGRCSVDGGFEPGEGATEACGSPGQQGFKLLGATYLDGTLSQAETSVDVVQPAGSEAMLVPSQKGVGFLHVPSLLGPRYLGWGLITEEVGGLVVWPDGARLFLESASAPSSTSAQILAGQSRGRLAEKVPCPGAPCRPFAFWLVDSSENAEPYGRGYGTTGDGEASANAAAISDDRIIVGGGFRFGALEIDGLTSPTEATADVALFLANVPNVAPQ
jgi:hypothetical protein